MADLVITATGVKPGTTAQTETGVAGVSITAGQLVFLAAATGKFGLYDADHATAENRVARGIALNGASADQALTVHRKGLITIGATVAAGTPYFGSAAPGGLCPAADVATGMYATFVGFGVSATQIDVNFVAAGVAKP